MPSAIEITHLTKQFRGVLAVNDLSFEVAQGRVTGFLGPNGSGKTTTLRMLLGLVKVTGGSATFGGRPYQQIEEPVRHVGAVLEATSFHPSRRAEDHLKMVAMSAGIPLIRVEEVLDLVGLADVGRRRVGKFSLGMRQRLQLATALLGDPEILILDEPANGLDPQGIQWLRTFIRHQASTGRSVLVSSHLLSEMEETVDDVVIVSQGQLVLQTTLAELTTRAGTSTGMRVRSPEIGRFTDMLTASAITFRTIAPDTISIDGATPEWLGPILAEHRIVVYEVAYEKGSLEDVFLTLTHGFEAAVPGGPSSTNDPVMPAGYGYQSGTGTPAPPPPGIPEGFGGPPPSPPPPPGIPEGFGGPPPPPPAPLPGGPS
jgi:ABC-2 type transport system ATP-binding protein